MGKLWMIAKKEYKSYFTSPLAYVLASAFLFIIGYMFFATVSHYNMQNLQSQQFNMGKGVSITDGILRPLYGNMNVILLFLIPLITMRLFAEEKKQQTLPFLLTSPTTLTQLVGGKFVGVMMLVLTILAPTLLYPVILFITGNPDLGPIFTSYLGLILLISSYVSVGLFFTSVTENQIVAGVLTLITLLFFWLISWAGQVTSSGLSEIFNYLSLITHFMNGFSRGIINSHDVVFYVSFAFVWLFLTHRSLDSYRWR